MDYKNIGHPADLKIKTFGRNKEELFKNTLKGMFKEAGYEGEGKKLRREIKIKSSDLESLLVDFLSEALYLSEVNQEVYSEIEIDVLSGKKIEGFLIGKELKRAETIIKGVTYHDLEVTRNNGNWEATILFDV